MANQQELTWADTECCLEDLSRPMDDRDRWRVIESQESDDDDDDDAGFSLKNTLKYDAFY